jgi:hypothetical protein
MRGGVDFCEELLYLVSDKCAVVADGHECLVLDGPVVTVTVKQQPLDKKFDS